MENSKLPHRCQASQASGERVDWLIAVAKRSHAVEELPDTIIEAVRSAKMDKRHNHLNKLMK